jgi:hypothetical protein
LCFLIKLDPVVSIKLDHVVSGAFGSSAIESPFGNKLSVNHRVLSHSLPSTPSNFVESIDSLVPSQSTVDCVVGVVMNQVPYR